MGVTELLSLIDESGVTLACYPAENRINAKPQSALTPEMVSGIKEHKGELLRIANAGQLGLVAQWSPEEFGYISLHDPTTGEWYDVETKDAPDWAKSEAFKRKDLYRSSNRRAYRLTAREMGELWEREHSVPVEEGIVEDHPVGDD